MNSRKKLSRATRLFVSATAVFQFALFNATNARAEIRFLHVAASDREQRSALANTGMSIETVHSDGVWGFANESEIAQIRELGFKILGSFPRKTGRGGHEGNFGFPPEDSRYHTYDQVRAALQSLVDKNGDIARLQSIGKSVEGRDLLALHINSTPEALASGKSQKSGAIFMGNHHAREHLSVEIPLMLAQYLLEHRADPQISNLLATRDLWIIPMVNPDGAEFDIAGADYQYWRKNRRDNGDGTFGTDLNRNYSYKWGTGGSSRDSSSDIYMGPKPFSEPETQAMRDFIEAHLNATVLLTFHSYSELVLYPWGHTYDPVGNDKDHQVFSKMARTMAAWNHYTAEQTSDLYIASGDTTDWAYGEHGIFAFTFELSPSGRSDGGFYPGAQIIDRVFQDNLRPCLYLMDVAGDPYQVIASQPSPWLKNYVEPRVPTELMWETHPISLR